jgi:hypothetical protein
MYKAKLISADFEESTMELEIQHEFTAKKGSYIIMEESDFEELSSKANTNQLEESEITAKDIQPLRLRGLLKMDNVVVDIENRLFAISSTDKGLKYTFIGVLTKSDS